MWPGILTVSKTEFKANSAAVVYAHKTLVKRYISSISDEELKRRSEDHDQDDGQVQAALSEETKGQSEAQDDQADE